MNNNIELLKLPKRTYLEDSPALFYSADEVSSVLDLSFQLIRAGVFPDFSALIARSQTKGRGRYGRVWLSPPGHLYGAVKLPQKPPFVGTLAPLAFAYEISLALQKVLGLTSLIKWPNDLIVSEKKVAGILLENREGSVVAGLGINLTNPPLVEREEGQMEPGAIDSPLLAAMLFEELCKSVFFRYTQLNRALAPSWDSDYASALSSRLYALNKQIRVLDAGSSSGTLYPELTATLTGLDPKGALILTGVTGTIQITSGTLLL